MEKLTKQLQAQFDKMCATGKLFIADVDNAELWLTYLHGFVNDPIFRDPDSTTHNCNACSNFIHRYGNIVSIGEDFKITSIFDIDIPSDNEYFAPITALQKLVHGSTVVGVFIETFDNLNSLPYETCKKNNNVFQLGVARNFKRYTKDEAEKYGVVNENEIITFNHLHLQLPKEFVDTSGKSREAIYGEYRDAKNVFKRGLDEISIETLKLVRDLILQGSLLNGETHLYKITTMIELKEQYDLLSASQKNNWCWVTSYKLPTAKFRNELIGVLCTELSSGDDLNEAVKNWNRRVDPANYMRAVAPITQQQINLANTFVSENGYAEGFERRCATIQDIKAADILHLNNADNTIKSVSIFDELKPTKVSSKNTNFDNVEEVGIERFMKDLLPQCTSVEVYLENRLENNLVTLTTSVNEGKNIFKWSNNFGWTYNGGLEGKSQIKQAVKSAGGNVEGILRGSLLWNESGTDNSDLDIWCSQPNGEKIGYSTRFRKDRSNGFSMCSGQLDIDNTMPGANLAVENIYFVSKEKLKDGNYHFWVNQFADRNSQGFQFELEFDGVTYNYIYTKRVVGNVPVVTVNVLNGSLKSIEHKLEPLINDQPKMIYGLNTNKFHKVNLICLSPNHWMDATGNKHYFFMLEGCTSPTDLKGWHSENLIPELAQHRAVLQMLSNKMLVKTVPEQLSGIGFNATVKDSVTVKLTGTHNRVIKITF